MWLVLIVSSLLIFSSCSPEDPFEDYCRCKGEFRIESSENPFFEITDCNDPSEIIDAFINLNVNVVYLGCVD